MIIKTLTIMKTPKVSEIGDLQLCDIEKNHTMQLDLTSRRVSCCEACPTSRNLVAVGSFV